jgi:tetratricopeptide (TPR) repeat protein
MALCTGSVWSAAEPGQGPIEAVAERQIEAVRDTMVDALWVKTDEYWHGQNPKEELHPENIDPILSICRMVIELDPHYTDAYSVAAWLLLQQGKDKQALDFYRQGIARNPDRYELAHELGLQYYLLRKHDAKGALPYLKRAAELPSPIPVKRTYAHALARAGKYQEAAAQWRRILQQSPADPIAIKELTKLRAAGKIGKEQ